MPEGNYKLRPDWSTNAFSEAEEALYGQWGLKMIQGSMVLIPNLRGAGFEGISARQPQLLHGPLTITREGVGCYRDNFPGHTQRDTRTTVSDGIRQTAAILTSSTADHNYEGHGRPFYEDTRALTQWAEQFKDWMKLLKESDPQDLAAMSEPFHYMRLLTSFGFPPERFGLEQAFLDFARPTVKAS